MQEVSNCHPPQVCNLLLAWMMVAIRLVLGFQMYPRLINITICHWGCHLKLHKFTEACLQFHGIEVKQPTSEVGSQKILQLQQNSKHETIPRLACNKLQSRALCASKSNLSFANVLSKKWHLFCFISLHINFSIIGTTFYSNACNF
jgi:hypothetical protein